MNNAGFFSTSAAEKTKNHAKNSRKNSASRSQLAQIKKTQEKPTYFARFSRGTPKNAICIKKYFQKMEVFHV